MSDSEEATRSFHLKEFELLKDEIKRRSDDQVNTEKLAIFSSAAIYSLLTAIPTSNQIMILWWVPPIVIIYSIIRWQSNDDTIQAIGRYIKQLERLLAKDGKGWEEENGQLHKNFRQQEYLHRNDRVNWLGWAGYLRKTAIYNENGETRIWMIMESIRFIILVITISIALFKTITDFL